MAFWPQTSSFSFERDFRMYKILIPHPNYEIRMTDNPFLKWDKWREPSLLKSAVVCYPLRDSGQFDIDGRMLKPLKPNYLNSKTTLNFFFKIGLQPTMNLLESALHTYTLSECIDSFDISSVPIMTDLATNIKPGILGV